MTAQVNEIKKIATRDSYGNALVELGKINNNLVVLDADLAAATKTSIFKKEFNDRHFDCGIAEQNMVCVAAGMSTMGLVPFVSTFAMFAAGRAFEQIRNTISYPHLNVKIGATHGGISVGEDGASHQCCEDFALMRSIPGMVVLSPSDDVEARAAVKAAYEYYGPVYIRFGRMAVPVFHDEDKFKFEIGKGEILKDGNDVAIIATGIMVNEAVEAAKRLKLEGINARVINICTIKPLDEELILNAAKDCKRIVTCEEHSIIGGLGDAVSGYLSQVNPVIIKKIGVNDEFGHSGPAKDLLNQFGLCADNIIEVVKQLLE
ncbi:transketolase family protein [Clostridium sp. SM-530-WT-3G]|uniref:transketolase family protein n=1 Tax=Clostridium sp. SM-530-WT-3G TaxID=2725303 RepID=UPI00145E68E0|nr:transketolase family protein [Clostridium sp. SM-530-WT-3G]NME84318.1 transketolase family protein [Clostridium sp. SM-530-WT-3G]